MCISLICHSHFHTHTHTHTQNLTQSVLVSVDVSIPVGIAVDWLSRKLYWADAGLSRIYVSELDGSSPLVLVTIDEGKLTDIVVHPMKG